MKPDGGEVGHDWCESEHEDATAGSLPSPAVADDCGENRRDIRDIDESDDAGRNEPATRPSGSGAILWWGIDRWTNERARRHRYESDQHDAPAGEQRRGDNGFPGERFGASDVWVGGSRRHEREASAGTRPAHSRLLA